MMDINKFGALVEDVRGRIERKFYPTSNKIFVPLSKYKKYQENLLFFTTNGV